ncbi:MAG TPA: class I SAM-dependent methyltransferase, partial [Candidatus Omnitrophota bacterium]|nr:class I SAM-dependent methyltransferase [Candidatus Omnitrophota bacterium]
TKALKSKGKFIFTTLNGLFPLFHSVNEFYKSNEKKGQSQCKECSFDFLTFRDHNTAVIEDDSGNKRELKCNERYYVPSEITWLLKTLGYKKIDIFGAKLGAYSRNDKLSPEYFEMLVVAEI